MPLGIQNGRMITRRALWVGVAAMFLGMKPFVGCATEHASWHGVEKIVAIGDVHGDYEQFVKLLKGTGLVDERLRWTGGRAHLVQTGDVVDRGPDSRKVLDLLMKLESEARRRGGRVHMLLGNHEAMNLYGDLRYTTPEEFAAFRTARSEEIREYFYQQHVEELKRKLPREQWPDFDRDYREQWFAIHPLGYFEHRYEFGPKGEYGKWLRDRNTVIKINDFLFVHGGISPKYASWTIDQINERVREELRDFSKLKDGIVVDEEGPLWYRGLALLPEDEIAGHVETVLKSHGVHHIVIGHTPTEGAVLPRLGGKILRIDVGLSAAYGRRLACLVVEKGKMYAYHRGKLVEIPTSGKLEDLVAYLKQCAVLDPQPSPLMPLIQQLESLLVTTIPSK